MKNIKETIANNITELRKKNNLTQNDLAKKLNYSDNTISRWEHAEITPSVENLQAIAEIFSIDIGDLFKENVTKTITKNNKNIFINKLTTTLISVSTVWLVALLFFIYTTTFLNANYWTAFIWALPISCFLLLTFNRYWKNKIFRFIVSTVLIWTLLLSIYLQLLQLSYNIFLIFLVGIPIQIALSLHTFLKKNEKEEKD